MEAVSEGVLERGEVGVEVRPGNKGGGEEGGVGLEFIEGLLQVLLLPVDEIQSRRYTL